MQYQYVKLLEKKQISCMMNRPSRHQISAFNTQLSLSRLANDGLRVNLCCNLNNFCVRIIVFAILIVLCV